MKRALGILATAAVGMVGGACAVHTKGPADVLKPEGEQVVVTLADNRQYEGELLAIADGKVYLMRGDKIAALDAAAMAKIRIVRYRVTQYAKDLDKTKLYSRYPPGLTPEQWQQLLQHQRQEAIEVLPEPR